MATYLNYPFDPELFCYNWKNEEDLVLTNMVNSGAIVENSEIAGLIANGGDFYSLPFYKVITGDTGNYDGATDVPVSDPEGGEQNGIVFGRMQGWKKKDFVFDYNSGADPMRQIQSQVAKFWNKQRQAIILKILNGIFAINDAEWNLHKKDICSTTVGTVVDANKIGATTVADAVTDALGDNGDKITLAFMHSRVAQNCANLNLLGYWKYTDANGIERKLRIGDMNGVTVIINDQLPYQPARTATAGVYKVKVGGTVTASESYTIDGVTVALGSSDNTPAKAATKIAAATFTNYTVTASDDTVTFTEASGKEGHGAPVCSAGSSSAATFTVTTTTPGYAACNAEYTTYLLGVGAIHHATAPVEYPVEVDRNAIRNGGEEVLITRIRETYHPNGFSFTKPVGYTASPSNDMLGASANWSIAASDVKSIPMIRIKSNG